MFKFWRKSLVQSAQKTTLNERLKERQQQIVYVDRAGAALKNEHLLAAFRKSRTLLYMNWSLP